MIGKALLAVTGVVGMLMLIPSGDGTSVATNSAPRESALATSPELARFLEDAVAPKAVAKSPEQVIADIAAEPEPGSPVPVKALTLPTAPSSTLVASTAPDTGPRAGITARSPVNMRSGPSTDHATLFVLQPDEPVTIVERDGGWAKVQRSNGTSGWVYGSYLGDGAGERVGMTEPRSEKPIREAKVQQEPMGIEASTRNAIRLRASPSAMSQTIVRVKPGTPLQIAEQRGGWLRVVLPDGVSGWVRGRV
jgi:SH3-like domain-containing protein